MGSKYEIVGGFKRRNVWNAAGRSEISDAMSNCVP